MSVGLPLTISAKIGHSRLYFLIDTGSVISLLPPNLPELSLFLRPTSVSLQTAAGTPIQCYGEVDIILGLKHLRRSFPWSFVVADVTQPILGMDFLRSQNLLVDCKNSLLIDTHTQCKIPLTTSSYPLSSYCINLSNVHPQVRQILAKYPILTSPLQLHSASDSVKSIVHHHIETGNNSPVHFKPRPLTGAKLEAAKEEFQFLLNAGIIQRSSSPWASPLHLVPKKEPGEWRPCGDYRLLNSITENDKYPIPHLRSLTMSLHGRKIFSKLDLQRAYLQIPVAEADIPKTAVTTPFGLYEYKFMPFGLKNAGPTFQRFIDSIFVNCKNIFTYLDDILIASENEEQHLSDLSNALSLLAENNLRLSIDKCEFFQTSLTFLGYEVSTAGIRPPANRVAAIAEFARPQCSRDLRRFMGMLNFFRQMVPNFAQIALPLTDLLRNYPSTKSLPWSDAAERSFSDLKQALAECPTLSFPSPKASHYHIVTDSSNFAVGAALYQLVDSKPAPIAFFSKKLSDLQKTYSTYDRELLGAYLAVLQFKSLIDGHSVTLFSDHKPIISAFYSKSIAKSDRQQRQLSFLSEYVTEVQYIKGHNNIVADCLSRPVCATNVDIFDLGNIATAQADDDELQSFKDRLKPYQLNSDELVLWCDTSTSSPRPYIPPTSRESIISFLHNLSHPGFKNTAKLVKQRYFWPSIDKEVSAFVKNCSKCQQAKVHKHTKTPISPIASPSDRFHTVHIDIVGPLPSASLPTVSYPLPFRYILTCIDRATRWCEAVPLIDTTASSVAIAFMSGWISRFGVPLEVVTDRGTQFEGELFSNLSSLLGFHHIRTTSYHPQSNGLVERFHRTLKAAIMARQENWFYSLPIVLMGLRMTPNSSGFSPFTAVTGTYMLCPQPLITKEIPNNLSPEFLNTFIEEMHKVDFPKLSQGTCHANPSSYIPSDLEKCDKVWMRVDRIRKSLEAPYSGPFEVLERNPKFFKLKLPQGDTTVSLDRLKPAYSSKNPPVLASENSKPVSPKPIIFTPSQPFPHKENQSTDTPTNSKHKKCTRSGRSVRFKVNPDYVYF